MGEVERVFKGLFRKYTNPALGRLKDICDHERVWSLCLSVCACVKHQCRAGGEHFTSDETHQIRVKLAD